MISALALLHLRELRVWRLAVFSQFVEEICIIVIVGASSSTPIPHSLQRFLILHIVKESNYHSAEKQGAQVDARYDLEKVLICEQALLEALVEEVGMVEHHIVDRLDSSKLSLEFV